MSNYFGAMGTALYSKLSGGTALITELGGTLIWQDVAPDEQALPYVVYSHQGGGPDNQNSHDMRDNLWYVRGYAASRAKAVAIDKQIDNLLNKHTLSASGYTNFWTVREEDISLVEAGPNQVRIYNMGGLYRIRLTT